MTRQLKRSISNIGVSPSLMINLSGIPMMRQSTSFYNVLNEIRGVAIGMNTGHWPVAEIVSMYRNVIWLALKSTMF